MTFTCFNGRIFGVLFIVGVCSLCHSDATLPIPLLGGNGSSLIPGFNPQQLGTLQRDLNLASSFLMNYANTHAQNTVNSLARGQLPRLPLAELALRTLSGGGANSGGGGRGGGASLGNIGDAIGGLLGSLGNAANRGTGSGSDDNGGGSSLGGARPRGPVTVTLAPDPPSDVAGSSFLSGGSRRSGAVTVTLAPDPTDAQAPSDVDIRSAPDVRVSRALLPAASGGATGGVDRAGDFQQLSNGQFRGCARSFAPLYQLIFCGRAGPVRPPGIREILRLINIAFGINN